MESTSSSVLLPCVNLRENCEGRREKIKEWRHQFNEEKEEIAALFSERVFSKTINLLQKSTSDPFYASFTQKKPLLLSYSLNSQNISSLFKNLLPKESLLFSWLTEEPKSSHEKTSKSKYLKKNHEDFNRFLFHIGEVVKKQLIEKFEQLKETEGNEKLQFHVSFVSQMQKHETNFCSIASIKSLGVNVLIVKAWMDTESEIPSSPLAGKTSKKPSGVLSLLFN